MWKKIGIYLLFSLSVVAQEKAATANQILEAVNTQKALKEASLVKNIPFEAIGPAVMSGRVVALAVNQQPTELMPMPREEVAHKDNGISDNLSWTTPYKNIGEIAVHWPSGTLLVGTGENNASRSSYAGMGLLKTMDNGKTWTHHGLAGSHHIGTLIHPNNPNHLVVGVTGAYTPNAERGVYVTTWWGPLEEDPLH